MNAINSSHLKTFYILLPLLIYTPGYFFAIFNGGSFKAHWYIDLLIEERMLLFVLFANLIIGICIHYSFKNLKIVFYKNKDVSSYLYSLLFLISMISYVHFPFSYLKLFFFVSSYFFLIRSSLRLSLISLLIYAICELIFGEFRWPIVFFIILLSSFYKYGILSSLFVIFFGMLFSVLVLNPIKHGNYEFDLQFSNIAIEIFNHLNPIFISAQFFYQLQVDSLALISESIPLAKSLLGYDGIISIAENAVDLPNAADFGSSSSSLSTYYVFSYVLFFLILLYFLSKIRLLNQILFFYFLSMGPLFFRRSFLNFINDIIVISIFTILIYSFFYLLLKLKVSSISS